MAKFDDVFAELQAKMAAAMAVISQYPDVAAEVRTAIEGALTEAQVQEQQAADDARANALNQLIVGVRQTLSEAVEAPPEN